MMLMTGAEPHCLDTFKISLHKVVAANVLKFQEGSEPGWDGVAKVFCNLSRRPKAHADSFFNDEAEKD